jgi:predicted alpha-1,2-mannosidase
MVAGIAAGCLVAVRPVATTDTAAAGLPGYVSDPASLVNTFIGTTNGGDTFPGSDVPFGMIQWSPDTPSRPDGGGYSYDDHSIIGYSLTHLSGPGCAAEGDVPILPTVGPIGPHPYNATEPLNHSLEQATPGYYQLTAGGIEAQLTTTLRAGIARFTFPRTSSANLILQLAESATGDSATEFQVVNDHEIAGHVTSGYFCGASNTYTLYFEMTFSQAFTSHGVWIDGSDVRAGVGRMSTRLTPSEVAGDMRSAAESAGEADAPLSSGKDGAYVTFDTTSDPLVLAKVGISYVSNANALLNCETEIPGWDFSAIKKSAESAWNEALDRIQIAGGAKAQQAEFYTALYHSLLHPNVASDVNGQYVGADGKVHSIQSGQTAEYANYSGWDIYRSEIQLEAMLFPQQTSDMVTSMLESYEQTGMLPKWSEDNGETYIMVGDPADSIIADAYAFGARGFDAGTALDDMEQEATVPNNTRPGLGYYESLGYLPIDGTYGCCNFYGPVSTQEEYDVADNSISLLAGDLGDTEAAADFATTAQNWQNVFDPNSGFLQPKELNGAFLPGFNPKETNPYVEADAYIYTAELPFDLEGLIAAVGGGKAWIGFLNGLTSSVTSMKAKRIQMGDEPSFDIPWEYDYAGVPYSTERVVREIQNDLYTDTPDGLPGNDDLGATSSWFVWSAIGGYPETPGSETVAAGSPMFKSIAVSLGDGNTLYEQAPSAGDGSPYVRNVTIDGSSWDGAFLPGTLFTNGGDVDWMLSSSPDKNWAAGAGDAPPSNTTGLQAGLGYIEGKNGGTIVMAPGSTRSITLGVQNMEDSAQQVSWTASSTSGSGITVQPSGGGTFRLPAEKKETQQVQISVPSTTSDGVYSIAFQLQSGSGAELPTVTEVVSVAG